MKVIQDSPYYTEIQFDSKDAATQAAEKEAIVCGDEIIPGDGFIDIYNFHQGESRWRGVFDITPNPVKGG